MRDRDVNEEQENPETDTTGDPGGEAQALLTSATKRTTLQPTDPPTPPPTGPGKDPII